MQMNLSKTVENFIKKFELEFEDYLKILSTNDLKEQELKTTYHKYRFPEHGKYSDWDIFCYINKEKITLPILISMDKWIKNFPEFEYIKNVEFNNKSTKGHYMGFMPYENEMPFIDIHLQDVGREMLDILFDKICVKGELNKWTSDWRKIKDWRKKSYGEDIKPERLGNLSSLKKDYPKVVEFLPSGEGWFQ